MDLTLYRTGGTGGQGGILPSDFIKLVNSIQTRAARSPLKPIWSDFWLKAVSSKYYNKVDSLQGKVNYAHQISACSLILKIFMTLFSIFQNVAWNSTTLFVFRLEPGWICMIEFQFANQFDNVPFRLSLLLHFLTNWKLTWLESRGT